MSLELFYGIAFGVGLFLAIKDLPPTVRVGIYLMLGSLALAALRVV